MLHDSYSLSDDSEGQEFTTARLIRAATLLAEALLPVAAVATAVLEAQARATPAKEERRKRVDLETQAIALLVTNGPNARAIADQLGIPRSTLCGWKKFRECYDRARGGPMGSPRRAFGRTREPVHYDPPIDA